MKWVFYALLALNIWYFAAHFSAVQVEPVALAPVPPQSNHINQLLMLEELEAGELQQRNEADGSVDAAVATGTAADDSTRQPAGREASIAPRAIVKASTVPYPRSSAPNAPPEGVCLSFGPLDDGALISQMRTWLGVRGGHTELREHERRELFRYWVYFPPFTSHAQAAQRVSGMRAKGIDDIFIIPRGDMGNAISLGVYSRRDSLHRRLDELRRKGYEPSVVPRYKTERAAWLDAVFPKDARLELAAFNQTFAGIEVSDAKCTPEALRHLLRLAPDEADSDSALTNQASRLLETSVPRKSSAPPSHPSWASGPQRKATIPSVVSSETPSEASRDESMQRVVSPDVQNYNAGEPRRPYVFSSSTELTDGNATAADSATGVEQSSGSAPRLGQ